VKRYVGSKYGADRVCSLGAYTSLQMRAVFRDFCKLRNVPQATVEFLSKIMFETRDNKNARASKAPWEYIFKLASRNQTLYDFVQSHAEMIEETRLCHAAPRAASVHPCATLILPEGESIYTSVPIRKTELKGSDMIISEWEGPYVEAAGYLKEDILGIIQLDKFRMIINLVKEHYGEDVDIYNLPLDEPGVYDMISKGLTGDVFQLGSRGLTAYSMQVKPTSVKELCAMVALFRPGPMDNGFHQEYVEVKNGRRELTYMEGLEEITKETYGLLAYQEQIMLITTHLAGFTLVEADNIRKGMGKVDKKFFAEQGQKFIEGAVKNGYDKDYVESLWHKMCAFGGYAYNKCLSGNTKLLRYTNNKSGRSAYHPTIAEMYKIRESYSYAKKHNHLSLRDKYRGEGFGTCWSLNEQNRLVKNRIVDIYYQGMRDVYKLTTESGKTIICTDNHKFPTVNGKGELKNLVVGKDQIFVSSGYKQEDTVYRFNEEGNNFPVKGQQGFQTRNTSFTQFDKYRREVASQKGCCDCCGEILNERKEVHHKDFNHGNNDWDNLETLCVSCHKQKHFSNPDRTKPGEKGLYTHLETIVSIEYAGREEVYDVEMADPYHTLTIDNGIVTSNSHALSYALTAYISQYLKWKYPLPYWITALEFASDENLPRFISEINRTGDILVSPPDINKSELQFYADFDTKKIVWSISRVKQCGEVAVSYIFAERQKGGPFFDFKEFLFRVDKSKVNKSVVENLILAGAFDDLCDIKMPSQRKKIINEYRELSGTKIDKTKDFLTLAVQEGKTDQEWWWLLQQKRVSGFAFFDYPTILQNEGFDLSKYLSLDEFEMEEMTETGSRIVTTAGIISEIEHKTSKRGDYCKFRIEQNYSFVWVIVWNESYKQYGEILQNCEGKIACVKARAYYDSFKGENALQSDNGFELKLVY
jgi:DNA polymerase III alpha subunit